MSFEKIVRGHEDESKIVDAELAKPGSYENIEVGRLAKLESIGLETRGIKPVPPEERQDTQYYKLFFVWFSANCNILSFSAGTLGPAIFGLGTRDSCLTILFFELLFCLMPAYASTWGPKLGMRQMVISRYSFGYYGVLLCCLLNLIGMCGFSILNCILGGQALSSVSDEHLSWTVGIVVIGIISLLVSFCGLSVLNWYERIVWFPIIITLAIALGLGGNNLSGTTYEPATARGVLSFVSTLAGFTITWTPLASDFSLYFKEDVKSWRIFLHSYLGFVLSTIPFQCAGAAVMAAAPSVPLWQERYALGDVGGLLEAMLQPVHGFGKFLTVLLSLSVIGNMAITFYSMAFNLQLCIPFFLKVPRYVFCVVGTAIVIPLSIAGQHRFYDTLINFLSLLGYWAAAFTTIIFMEHFYFRKNDFSLYDPEMWNSPSLLPTGLPAVAAVIFSFGPVIPCMDQVWYVGPIAEKTGDIGFEMAFVVGAILYFVFRSLEIKWRGRI
ncbi:hypothetical protein AGABI1DRAFT_122979 [Agaricus bisporus var. burnettii JB137-S8]|uniref:Cytosine-purine permease n=1 Tax=Agaricus bisporus var. burnettii (strain JB137-S8 / ATCC MYA-4627 / FGSC 10392) TaxID=597362 RepID=K5WZ08_AGABU|nr:uncharacterized protein AGABI1DRAFT_122979 [Agaricus bisporus var. burnettii JB137-S8]EKM75847.1 hypothetical protein AGABI1DRAFT_122979 [Agaricus bisporus var. burnettii JB137-S8]